VCAYALSLVGGVYKAGEAEYGLDDDDDVVSVIVYC